MGEAAVGRVVAEPTSTRWPANGCARSTPQSRKGTGAPGQAHLEPVPVTRRHGDA